MSLLFLAASLAAIQPAAETVEVEVAVQGIAKVPAQGYHVEAVFPRAAEWGEGEEPASNVTKQLAALESDKPWDTCAPWGPIGFVGNGKPSDSGGFEEIIPAIDVETGEETYLPTREPLRYSGTFMYPAEAEQASRLLKAEGAAILVASPVVLDCSEGETQAKRDALVKSKQEAALIAEILGMRLKGVTRIVTDEPSPAEHLGMVFALREELGKRNVTIVQRLKVTYQLEK